VGKASPSKDGYLPFYSLVNFPRDMLGLGNVNYHVQIELE
jgi:hypothetical protein